jgi:thiamine-monophosphate kinase
MVFAMDTINEGVHFPAGIDPAAIGHRALAVNLSDLAAMGAEPAWASLSLSITDPQADWVGAFSRGLQSLAARHGVALVGGDTVGGPPSVSLHLAGFVEAGMHLTRAGARPGDRVYATGCLGEAAFGLRRWRAGDRDDPAVERFLWPEPRVAEGRDLVGLATACIDVSDGLAMDLGRIADASGVHIVIDLDAVPVGGLMAGRMPDEDARLLALTGGDDYELCFTVPDHGEAALLEVAAEWPCRPTRIGRVTKGAGVSFLLAGRAVSPDLRDAWSHFGDHSA